MRIFDTLCLATTYSNRLNTIGLANCEPRRAEPGIKIETRMATAQKGTGRRRARGGPRFGNRGAGT
jgi:hypothetical protein